MNNPQIRMVGHICSECSMSSKEFKEYCRRSKTVTVGDMEDMVKLLLEKLTVPLL